MPDRRSSTDNPCGEKTSCGGVLHAGSPMSFLETVALAAGHAVRLLQSRTAFVTTSTIEIEPPLAGAFQPCSLTMTTDLERTNCRSSGFANPHNVESPVGLSILSQGRSASPAATATTRYASRSRNSAGCLIVPLRAA